MTGPFDLRRPLRTLPPTARSLPGLGLAALLAAALASGAGAARDRPAAPGPQDPDTKAWWSLTRALSSDAMEGRDTGSEGYRRAAAVVAARFRAAGLTGGGTDGGFLQEVPMAEAAIPKVDARFAIARPDGTRIPLEFLHDLSLRPLPGLGSALDAPMVFRGYCAPGDLGPDVRGRVVVCFGARRDGLPSAADRARAAERAGAAAVVSVDDPGFTEEPSRWPEAYARTVWLREPGAEPKGALPNIRLSDAAFAKALSGSGRSASAIFAAGDAKAPLPAFDIPGRFTGSWRVLRRSYQSPNVLGLLPGTDPDLKRQVLVVSAHLDGYGYGEPVAGDALYNGAFDDAAYVATLARLAERRAGEGFRRTVLFAAFTGEEKGLLGARWFVGHPTVPKPDLAADINLDQLRPLFPLKSLTMLALDRSTLGADAEAVAARLGVRIHADREPERRLLMRADHWPFLQTGVPATGFIFGFEPGTEAERRYRAWYRVRYHRPQDDVTQPIDFKAAGDFNRFFYDLVARVADEEARPRLLSGGEAKPAG